MKKENFKITVAGTGYVGLSIATLLSQKYDVTAIDINLEKVNMINERKSPIEDKEIEYFFSTKNLNLIATTNEKDAYSNADFVIIATPTNYNVKTNSFDTIEIEKVINLVKFYNPNAIVVIKSTIPIGYTKNIRKTLNFENILFSPEFLREGMALYDNLYPSRIIVGTDKNNKKLFNFANLFLTLLKETSLKKEIDTYIMNFNEAEAVKLFSNTFLAMRVAYFNELDTYAELNGLNTEDIINGVSSDSRIGFYYNNPSFGYGGYCLPKDTQQLLSNYENIPQNLISAIVNSNSTRKNHIVNQILKIVNYENNNSSNIIIGIFRLTMKSNSDNFRESAVQDIINSLFSKGLKVIIYEPKLKNKNLFLNCEIENNLNVFKNKCTLIVTNRFNNNLENVKNKVYTRDIFKCD